MSWDHPVRAWATGAVAVVALLAGGCGSGAVDGPDDDDTLSDQASDASDGSDSAGSGEGGGNGGDGDSGGDDGGGGGGGGGDDYSWSLPVGDLTPDDAKILYDALHAGCDAGEDAVATDQYRNLSDEQRNLYDAAIAVCRGDVESGRTLFAGAGYGGSRSMCFIYVGVVSVLEQRPPDTSGCPPNPGQGTTTTTEPGESSTSTESTSTTGGETTSSTAGGDTTTTDATGVGEGTG